MNEEVSNFIPINKKVELVGTFKGFVVGLVMRDEYVLYSKMYEDTSKDGFDLSKISDVLVIKTNNLKGNDDKRAVLKVPVVDFVRDVESGQVELINAELIIRGKNRLLSLGYSNYKMLLYSKSGSVMNNKGLLTVFARFDIVNPTPIVLNQFKVDEMALSSKTKKDPTLTVYGVFTPARGVEYYTSNHLVLLMNKYMDTKVGLNTGFSTTVKLVRYQGVNVVSAINYQMPTYVIDMEEKEMTMEEFINLPFGEKKTTGRMSTSEMHKRHRNKVLARYMKAFLRGNLRKQIVSVKDIKTERSKKQHHADIEILIEEVFGKLYPERLSLIKKEFADETIWNIIEYFLVTLIADKGGYVNKGSGIEVNTGNSKYFGRKKNIAQKLTPAPKIALFAQNFNEGYDDLVKSYYLMREKLFNREFYAYTDRMVYQDSILKDKEKPLYRLLMTYKANYKEDTFRYRVEDFGFSHGKGFEALLVTKDTKDFAMLAEDARIVRSVEFTKKTLSTLGKTYTIGGIRYEGKFAGVNMPEPKGEYVGSYVIPALLNKFVDWGISGDGLGIPLKTHKNGERKEYYHNQKELQVWATTLLVLDELELFNAMASTKELNIKFGDDVELLQSSLKRLVDNMREEEREAIYSGFYLLPYLEYKRGESFSSKVNSEIDRVLENLSPAFDKYIQLINVQLEISDSTHDKDIAYPFIGNYRSRKPII